MKVGRSVSPWGPLSASTLSPSQQRRASRGLKRPQNGAVASRLLVADQLPHLAAERVQAHQPQRGAVRAGVEAGAGQRPLQPDQRAGRAGVQPRDAQLLVPVTCNTPVSKNH